MITYIFRVLFYFGLHFFSRLFGLQCFKVPSFKRSKEWGETFDLFENVLRTRTTDSYTQVGHSWRKKKNQCKSHTCGVTRFIHGFIHGKGTGNKWQFFAQHGVALLEHGTRSANSWFRRWSRGLGLIYLPQKVPFSQLIIGGKRTGDGWKRAVVPEDPRLGPGKFVPPGRGHCVPEGTNIRVLEPKPDRRTFAEDSRR